MSERYLAIETSSPRLSLALGDDQKVVAQYQGPLAWRHAEMLFKGIDRLLKKVRWTHASVTGIAVSTGPGSFTGIRIGLAAARAWAQANGVKVVGVNALEIMAAGVPKALLVAPVLNALRGGVFAGLYERSAQGWKRRGPESHLPLETWKRQLGQKVKKGETVTLAGDGLTLFDRASLPVRSVTAPRRTWYPSAAVLLDLARPRMAQAGSYKDLLPFYLREAAVTERRRG